MNRRSVLIALTCALGGAAAPPGAGAVAASRGGVITWGPEGCWVAAGGDALHRLPDALAPGIDPVPTALGVWLVTSTGALRRWDADAPWQLRCTVRFDAPVHAMAASPDGRWALAAHGERLSLLDQRGEVARTFDGIDLKRESRGAATALFSLPQRRSFFAAWPALGESWEISLDPAGRTDLRRPGARLPHGRGHREAGLPGCAPCAAGAADARLQLCRCPCPLAGGGTRRRGGGGAPGRAPPHRHPARGWCESRGRRAAPGLAWAGPARVVAACRQRDPCLRHGALGTCRRLHAARAGAPVAGHRGCGVGPGRRAWCGRRSSCFATVRRMRGSAWAAWQGRCWPCAAAGQRSQTLALRADPPALLLLDAVEGVLRTWPLPPATVCAEPPGCRWPDAVWQSVDACDPSRGERARRPLPANRDRAASIVDRAAGQPEQQRQPERRADVVQ